MSYTPPLLNVLVANDQPVPVCIDSVESPMGWVRVTATRDAIIGVAFSETPMTEAPNKVCYQAVQQLDEYFAGTRRAFELPLVVNGSAFQTAVWRALQKIPYGVTQSYAGLARAIDRPRAARAVGAANGRNPLGIIVPCHRVIGANGALTGFAHGVERKQWLLTHEAKHA